LGFNFVEKPVVRHPIPREEGGVSIDNDEPKANPSEKPKDLFKPEDFEGDFENKYDIPAFLRGK